MVVQAFRTFFKKQLLMMIPLLFLAGMLLFFGGGREDMWLAAAFGAVLLLFIAGTWVFWVAKVWRLDQKLRALPFGKAEELETDFVCANRMGDLHFAKEYLIIHQCKGTMVYTYDLIAYREIEKLVFIINQGEQLLWIYTTTGRCKLRMDVPLSPQEQQGLREEIKRFALDQERVGAQDDSVWRERQAEVSRRKRAQIRKSPLWIIALSFGLFFLYGGVMMLLFRLPDWMEGWGGSEPQIAFWPNLLLLIWSAVMIVLLLVVPCIRMRHCDLENYSLKFVVQMWFLILLFAGLAGFLAYIACESEDAIAHVFGVILGNL